MFGAPNMAELTTRGPGRSRRSSTNVPSYMKQTHHQHSPKRRARGKGKHDEERGHKKKAPFMDEKQQERALNLGVERIVAMCHDGIGVYDAIVKAVGEVNAKANRDCNLARVTGEQLARWFDMLVEGRHRKRRQRRERRKNKPGSALEVFQRKEEERLHVEAPPRVAHRSTQIREVMRVMLRAWNTQVGISNEAMANEAEHLRMEMSKQCIGKTNSKDEERRYYKWVIFCSWKLYHRRILIARRRAQRRAKFKGAIAKALVIPGLSKGASVSTLGVGAAGVNATCQFARKLKLKQRGGALRGHDGPGGVLGGAPEYTGDPTKFLTGWETGDGFSPFSREAPVISRV